MVSFGRADRAALSEAYLEPFAKATGIAVNSFSYDGQVTELTQMVHAGAPVWDVMQVESRTLEQGCRQGLFEKLGSGARSVRHGSHSRSAVGSVAWGFSPGRKHWSIPSNSATGRDSWAEFWDTVNTPANAGSGAAPNTHWRSHCWPTASLPRTCTPRFDRSRGAARFPQAG